MKLQNENYFVQLYYFIIILIVPKTINKYS